MAVAAHRHLLGAGDAVLWDAGGRVALGAHMQHVGQGTRGLVLTCRGHRRRDAGGMPAAAWDCRRTRSTG